MTEQSDLCDIHGFMSGEEASHETFYGVSLAGNKIEWGRRLWLFLFDLAQAYNPRSRPQRESMLEILNALPHRLPCPECRVHTAEFLRQFPPDKPCLLLETTGELIVPLDSAENLTDWLILFRERSKEA